MSLTRKVRTALLLLRWLSVRGWYRLSDAQVENMAGDHYVNPEQFIRDLIAQRHGQSFLEIGIGSSPNVERLQLMSQYGGSYTACDFGDVCELHQRMIKSASVLNGLDARFLDNRHGGTYAWTLFELAARGETFDIIYLDGHHTFYIDAPALVLGHILLKPGGVYLLDDISWTLMFMRNQLATSFDEWRFYRKMYDFSLYDEAQQRLPHVRMLAETILLNKFGYSKLEQYSTPHWWALQKPAS